MIFRPYSPSSLVQYQHCPAFFKFKRTIPQTSPPTPAENVGKAFHRFQSQMAWERLSGRSDMNKIFIDASAGLTADEQKRLKSLVYHHNFQYLLPAFDSSNRDIGIERKLAIDEEMNTCDFESKTAYFRGIPDFFWVINSEKKAVLVDFKTGAENPMYFFQIQCYSILLFAFYPALQEIETILDFAGASYLAQDLVTRVKQIEFFEKIRGMIGEIEHRMSLDDTKTGKHCDWCELKKNCREWKKKHGFKFMGSI